MFDTIIRGGEVVDGTGAPRRRADVAITDGRIVAIGDIDGDAAHIIDAGGLIVAPGFVDVHTHYDAQVFWDTTLSPSPLHGVTTIIGGNCGFTIAPLSTDPADGEYLMRMLARVEGMPLESLQQGVPWDWTTTAEYFDKIDGTLSINAGFKVGHSALRRVVMGADATGNEATPGQIDEMKALLRAGLDAGALGFSSSWARTHNDAEGDMVPSRYATRDELVELCSVLADYEGTSVEFLPMVGRFDDATFDLMTAMSAAAKSPLNWNIMTVSEANLDDCLHQLEGGTRAAGQGAKVIALTIPMRVEIRLSFLTGFVLDALPGWESAMALPPAEKLALLTDPARRAELNVLSQQDGPLKGLANWSSKVIVEAFTPDTKKFEGRTIGDIAEEQGKEPFDALVDIVVADDLRTAFGTEQLPESDADWEARRKIWRDGRAVIGASDAGAHLDLLGTFNYTTSMLGQAVREGGHLELEEAVHLLTDVQAQLYGLKQRGQIQDGWHADLVIFDEETVATKPSYTRFDLPGDASRIYAEADGIAHVLVAGTEIVTHGAFTDARPGTLLRSGRDTVSPSLT